METTYSFFLKNREEAVEVEGVKLDDDGTKITVTNARNQVVGVFAWSELQGFVAEG
jgi:hypothetical protein